MPNNEAKPPRLVTVNEKTIEALSQQLAFANDAAAKGEKARLNAEGMEQEITDLKQELSTLRQQSEKAQSTGFCQTYQALEKSHGELVGALEALDYAVAFAAIEDEAEHKAVAEALLVARKALTNAINLKER